MATPLSVFKSIFKINGKPILGPVMTEETRREILEIREACRAQEEKLKIQKDLANEAKKNDLMRSRSDSYTLSSPIFAAEFLPEILNSAQEEHPEKDEDAHKSLQTSIVEEINYDDSVVETEKEEAEKDQIEKEEVAGDGTEKNEVVEVQPEKEANEEEKALPDESAQTNQSEIVEASNTPVPDNPYEFFQPQLKTQIQDLIKRQKEEYMDTVNILKRKFLSEQQQLLDNLQNSVQNMTSTPLQNVSIAPTEDEEFVEFQTCLQSINLEVDTTLTDDNAVKEKAATVINAHARGFLVRRLLKTVYVEECIKNIQDTLQFILTLGSHHTDEIQDILLKTKLFNQLQSDLYRLYGIFFELSTREKMKLIASDRERRRKNINKKERLNSSLQL